MSKKHRIAILVILFMVLISTFFRWYIFHIELKINFLLSLVSGIVLTFTWLFFGKLYAYLDRVMPYDKRIFKRLFLQTIITLVFLSIVTRFVYAIGVNFIPFQELVVKQFTGLAQVTGIAAEILLIILLNVAHFSYYSLEKWRENALRASNLEKEKSHVQFDNLKNQLNPHFLFNSLTSLDSLIQENPALAREFLQQLSKVFRYVLKNKEKGLVSLETELTFIRNYVALLKTRFGESLNIDFNISEDILDLHIVPVTLQILIENALKHNIINQSNPLTISILNQENYLIIENRIQQKKQVETSNGQGLNNLKSLYGFLIDQEVLIEQNGVFRVKVPLI